MKPIEALALKEGDLVDAYSPRYREHLHGYKVLVVSKRGRVFVTAKCLVDHQGIWGVWVPCHFVKTLGRREELTSQERTLQRAEHDRNFRWARRQSFHLRAEPTVVPWPPAHWPQ
jgi:hypothetical protein